MPKYIEKTGEREISISAIFTNGSAFLENKNFASQISIYDWIHNNMVPPTTREKKPKRKLKRPDSNIKRKRKFTRRNRRLIYEALRAGLAIGKAIELAGLDRSTYYRWMEKGKDKRNPVHVRFRNHVNRIHAKLELEKINTIRKVAKGGYEIKKTSIKFYKRCNTITKRQSLCQKRKKKNRLITGVIYEKERDMERGKWALFENIMRAL